MNNNKNNRVKENVNISLTKSNDSDQEFDEPTPQNVEQKIDLVKSFFFSVKMKLNLIGFLFCCYWLESNEIYSTNMVLC